MHIALQVIAGWDANPWIKAGSRGEAAHHLQKAAQCDLNNLQAMALTNQELVELLEGAVSDLPPDWLNAGQHLCLWGHSEGWQIILNASHFCTAESNWLPVASFGQFTHHCCTQTFRTTKSIRLSVIFLP